MIVAKKATPTDYVDSNYSAFEKLQPEFNPEDAGKYAVLADGKLIGVFETLSDADHTGHLVVPSGEYIVQQIQAPALDLGTYSRAGSI